MTRIIQRGSPANWQYVVTNVCDCCDPKTKYQIVPITDRMVGAKELVNSDEVYYFERNQTNDDIAVWTICPMGGELVRTERPDDF